MKNVSPEELIAEYGNAVLDCSEYWNQCLKEPKSKNRKLLTASKKLFQALTDRPPTKQEERVMNFLDDQT